MTSSCDGQKKCYTAEGFVRRKKKPQENITKYAAVYANRLWEIFYSVYNQNADIGWHKFRLHKQRGEKQEKG